MRSKKKAENKKSYRDIIIKYKKLNKYIKRVREIKWIGMKCNKK